MRTDTALLVVAVRYVRGGSAGEATTGASLPSSCGVLAAVGGGLPLHRVERLNVGRATPLLESADRAYAEFVYDPMLASIRFAVGAYHSTTPAASFHILGHAWLDCF